MERKRIITIDRQYGSGGERIGEMLAEKLEIPCFDREILAEASRESNIGEEVFRTFDEMLIDAGTYSMVHDARAAQSIPGSYRQPIAEQVYLAEFNTIKKLAEDHSGVFIGRCSDCVLQRCTNAVHFFIHAPVDVRVEKVCRWENLSHREAEFIVRKKDREREKYYNYYTDRKWGDISHYHLVVDTGRLELEDAVSLLEQYVRCAEKTRCRY